MAAVNKTCSDHKLLVKRASTSVIKKKITTFLFQSEQIQPLFNNCLDNCLLKKGNDSSLEEQKKKFECLS